MRAKYAVYAIPGCFPDDIVSHVTIDIYNDDPNCEECRYAAIQAAGYDFYDDRSNQSGPPYGAKFVGYDEPTVEIPVELIERVVDVVNINQKESISRDSQCVAVMADVLMSASLINRAEDYSYYTPIE